MNKLGKTISTNTRVGDSAVSNPVTGTVPDDGNSGEFGANEWLVDEMYERYLVDKNSVDQSWWPILEGYHPVTDPTPTPSIPVAVAEPEATPEETAPEEVPVETAPAELAEPAPQTGATPSLLRGWLGAPRAPYQLLLRAPGGGWVSWLPCRSI